MKKIYKILGTSMLSLALAMIPSKLESYEESKKIIIEEETIQESQKAAPREWVSGLENLIKERVNKLTDCNGKEYCTKKALLEDSISKLTPYNNFINQSVIRKELISALVIMESNVDPRARSPRGAVGLVQLMPQTAKELGLKIGKFDERYHPKSILAGANYLKSLYNLYNDDMVLALIAYNYGMGETNKIINRHGRERIKKLRHVPNETKKFVLGVGAYDSILNNPNKFGLYPAKKPLFSEERKSITGYLVKPNDTISLIASLHGVDPKNIIMLNSKKNPNKLAINELLFIPPSYDRNIGKYN
ncbi:transglycosylase SLT domain-containing protein [Candidatus Woesearchaeota archaeon]|nr:transglycosylase SLT domain-containing protein [Candidatus Woesearchaeota archaeon]